MTPVARLLEAAKRGDKRAAADLLPLVYDELRKLAALKRASGKPTNYAIRSRRHTSA